MAHHCWRLTTGHGRALVAAGGCEVASTDWWISGGMNRSWGQPQAIPSLARGAIQGLLGSARDWLAAPQRKAKLLPCCTSAGSSASSISQDLLCHLGWRQRLSVPFPLSIKPRGFAELLRSCSAAMWPRHVQHWHWAGSGLLFPSGAAKHQASLSAHAGHGAGVQKDAVRRCTRKPQIS